MAYSTVDEYIADFPRPVQTALKRVRRTIRKAAPAAVELIAYRIPAYKLNGRVLIYFAGWKEHYSIYPLTAGVAATFRNELKSYETSKGTIRFPLDKPVPVALIEGVVKVRADEVAAASNRAARKRSTRAKR
jgi:uncharacterized protein YdhG (YjbR/CyaY superfamily)